MNRGHQAAEVRRRASKGALQVGLRSLSLLVIGFGGNVALARLLDPKAFGIVALGYVLITAATVLTDGGLGAALIRGPVPPERPDLASVTGIQFAATALIVAIAGVITIVIGGDASVTLVMLCSLPILTLQTPATIVLERDLDFPPQIWSDVAQSISYTAWSIVAVGVFGAGVWGVATAVVASALISTCVLWVLTPMRFVVPSLDFKRLRTIWGFGVRFQLIDLTALIRDQGINTLTGAVGGLSILGLWSLTYRMLQPATIIFGTLRRVSYPGMARLQELGEGSAEIVERALSMSCVASSFVIVPLAASARALVPAVFGARWAPCADTLSMATWAMLLSGPLSVAASGYLLALGGAREVLNIVIAHSVVGLCAAGALLPLAGVDALGYTSIAMGLCDVAMFSIALGRHAPGFRAFQGLIRPIIVCTLAAGVGWLVTDELGRNLLDAAAGAAVALAFVLLGHWFTERKAMLSLKRTALNAVRSASVPTAAE